MYLFVCNWMSCLFIYKPFIIVASKQDSTIEYTIGFILNWIRCDNVSIVCTGSFLCSCLSLSNSFGCFSQLLIVVWMCVVMLVLQGLYWAPQSLVAWGTFMKIRYLYILHSLCGRYSSFLKPSLMFYGNSLFILLSFHWKWSRVYVHYQKTVEIRI